MTGTGGWTPFLACAGIVLLASLALGLAPSSPGAQARLESTTLGATGTFVLRAPLLAAVVGMYALFDATALTLLPVYGLAEGLTAEAAALLVSVFLLGMVLSQLGIGWLLDRIRKTNVVLGCAVLSALACALLPAAFALAVAAWMVIFVAGAVSFGLYTGVLAILGERYRGGELVAGSASFAALYGLGGTLGPFASGGVMDHFGADAMAYLFASLFLVLALGVLLRRMLYAPPADGTGAAPPGGHPRARAPPCASGSGPGRLRPAGRRLERLGPALAQHPLAEGRDFRLGGRSLRVHEIVREVRCGLHAQREGLDEPALGELLRGQELVAERDALALDRRLRGQRADVEARPARRVDVANAGREQPHAPVRPRLLLALPIRVNERVPAQIVGPAQGVRALEEARAAHGEHHLGAVGQPMHHEPRVDARPVANADVHILTLEVHQAVRGVDPHLDLGVQGLKAIQARHQPLGGESRHNADDECRVRIVHPKELGGLGQPLESLPERNQARLPGLGDDHRARQAAEELHTEVVLEGAHLLADGRGGHVQFLGRLREAQVTRGGLEGPQGVQGRELARHCE